MIALNVGINSLQTFFYLIVPLWPTRKGSQSFDDDADCCLSNVVAEKREQSKVALKS